MCEDMIKEALIFVSKVSRKHRFLQGRKELETGGFIMEVEVVARF